MRSTRCCDASTTRCRLTSKSSEISRFNASDSTDWFEVSKETALVVDFAQQVSRKTEGAFDVTVGPLVNAWSFGPDPQTRTIPDATRLRGIGAIGWVRKIVRSPRSSGAAKVTSRSCSVDLSAIAKGHGVDRVVQLLNDAGAKNVFVEIGGEVRTSGSKSGQWWKVGIQMPDAERDAVMIAHAMSTGAGNDQSMATSGDYRNFFRGRRRSLFSHDRPADCQTGESLACLGFGGHRKLHGRRCLGNSDQRARSRSRFASSPKAKVSTCCSFVAARMDLCLPAREPWPSTRRRPPMRKPARQRRSPSPRAIAQFGRRVGDHRGGVRDGIVRDGGRRHVRTSIDQRIVRRLGQLKE